MTPADAAHFVATHRAAIQRATAAFAKRYGLSREDAAHFAERVDAALSADDYRIICSFRGGVNPSTFITVAVWHVGRDFRDSSVGSDWQFAPTARHAPVSLAPRLDVDRAGDVSRFERAWPIIAADVVVGRADLRVLSGLVATTLFPTAAYGMIAAAAEQLGDRLKGSSYWSPTQGDFAAALAAQWSGPTLSLTTALGEPIPVSSIAVVDIDRFSDIRRLSVVVDFRLAATAIPAILSRPVRSGPGIAPRPAA